MTKLSLRKFLLNITTLEGFFSSSIPFFASSDMSRTDLKNFLSLFEFLNKLT